MARQHERIDPFLAAFSELWKLHPDQRFGQLVMNVLGASDRDAGQIWNMEEDEWLQLIAHARRVWHGIS